MASYKVTFEGESFTSDDDKFIEFTEPTSSDVQVQEDFMPKMFEYLESDLPYEILYQIKTISKDGNNLESKGYVSVIFENDDGSKGGLLMKDEDGVLALVGTWNVSNIKSSLDDLYSQPESFQLVVVALSESIAP